MAVMVHPRTVLTWLAVGSMLLCVAGGPGCGRRASASGHNLLLVTLDTVRADRLGVYGHVRAETPALDRLARSGARFEMAISAVPLTLPSHATLLSGWLPPRHGLRNNGAGKFPESLETLATRLATAGYRTAAFIGAFVLDRRFGLSRGFDQYDDEIDRDVTRSAGLGAERSGSIVVDRALAWLAGLDPKEARPFFIWVHLYDAHAPYAAPEPFRTRHADDPYNGEIAFVDAQVARLLDALDSGGRSQRTVVAVVADHGEALGEHGELTHGLLLYDASLRVPFIARAPGVVRAGAVVRTPVGLADVGPTLAALLEQPLRTVGLDGRDLSAALRSGQEPAVRDLYAETEYPGTFAWSDLAALRRGNLKYIAAPTPELYDLEQDPTEQFNLAAAPQRRAAFEGHIAELGRSLAAMRAVAPAVERPGMDAETRERLASLGYAGGASSPPSAGSLRGKDPKALVGLFRGFEEANWALQDGRLETATTKLEALVAADGNPVFLGLLAQAWRRRGKTARAVQLYEQALKLAPEDAQVRYDLAVTLQEARRPAEALSALQEAIRRDPGRPEAHNALGIALFAGGKAEQALAEFERACSIDPRDARAHNNRGNVLRQVGRYLEAEKAYARAMELAPSYADPWNGMGTLEVQRDRPAAAVPYFDRALVLTPRFHEARLNRAIALEMIGDRSGAAAAYADFLKATRGDAAYSEQRRAAAQLAARLSVRKEQ